MRLTLRPIVLFAAVLMLASGCELKTKSNSQAGASASKSSHGDHDHGDHDHGDHGHGDHSHGDAKAGAAKAGAAKEHDHAGHSHAEHGPHGGHIAHFDTNTTTHFEWAHDDDKHTLTIYFEELVSAGTKVESVELIVTSNGEEKKFQLAPVESAKIAGSVFAITDAEALTLVGASGDDPKGVQAKLFATIEGKRESALLKDDHHH